MRATIPPSKNVPFHEAKQYIIVNQVKSSKVYVKALDIKTLQEATCPLGQDTSAWDVYGPSVTMTQLFLSLVSWHSFKIQVSGGQEASESGPNLSKIIEE